MICFPSIGNDIIAEYCGWHADIRKIDMYTTDTSPDGKWDFEVEPGFDGPRSQWEICLQSTETYKYIWSRIGEGYVYPRPTWSRNSRYFKFAIRSTGEPQFYRVDIRNQWLDPADNLAHNT